MVISVYTQNPFWDSLATITIGLLLGCVAIFLAAQARTLLLGKTIGDKTKAKLIAKLKAEDIITSVHDVKALVLGAGNIRFKADIEFDGQKLSQKLLTTKDLPGDFAKITSEAEFAAYLVNFWWRVSRKSWRRGRSGLRSNCRRIFRR